MSETISILGAGSWGLAIARLLNINGYPVKIWEFNNKDYQLLLKHRTHPNKLPDCRLDESILITNDIDECLENADLVVLAVPSQFLRSALKNIILISVI